MTVSDETAEQILAESHRILGQVTTILEGHGMATVGVVLAELTALWLASHPPSKREEAANHHYSVTIALIPACESAINDRPEPVVAVADGG